MKFVIIDFNLISSMLYAQSFIIRSRISGQYETDEKDKTLIDEHDAFEKNVLKSFTKNRAFKTRHKLKAHTSKIVSSFKTPSLSCSLVKEYKVCIFDSRYTKFCKTKLMLYLKNTNIKLLNNRAIKMVYGILVYPG